MRPIDADALIMEMDAGCMPIRDKGISGITGDESCIKDYIDKAPTIKAEPEESEPDMSRFADVTVALHFEVRNSEIWGGKGTVGYTRLVYDSCQEFDYRNINNIFIENQFNIVAHAANVDKSDIRLISKQEYDENTEDDEDD